MKVLVTGGAGFIGANLIEYIAKREEGHELIVLDDLSTGRRANLAGLPAKFVHGSVADLSTVRDAVDGVEAIVHLGALGSVPRSVNDPISSHVANLTGTLNVLEEARRVGAYVVFASSSSVYGANKKLPKSEYDWTRPMSPYAVTKLGAEAYVLAYQFAYGLSSLAFRFFNVYGPKQAADHIYAAVIPKFIDAAMKNEPLVVHGDGLQSRDFTHVDTVCQTIWSAVSNRVTLPDPVNLAFGTSTTLLELIRVVETELGQQLRVKHIDSRVGDVRASQSDGIGMAKHFPEIQPIPLGIGVKSTIDWFRTL